MPFGIFDFHKDITSLHVGCEKPHAYFIPYTSEADALRSVRDYSPYFKSLIGAWDFSFYESVDDVPDPRAAEIAYCEKMNVPSNWQYAIGRGYDVPQYTNSNYPFPADPPFVPSKNPAALYRREFTLTGEFIKNKELMLNFEGVDSCFYLFLNGEFVGYSQVSHMTSEFNATPYLKEGKNEITLLVLKWCDGSYLEDQDMYRASGIFREVYILARDKARIEDIFVKAIPEKSLKSAPVSAEIRTVGKCEVKYALKDACGKLVFEGKKEIDGKEKIEIGTLAEPKLWSDESPYLYTLTLTSGSEITVIPVGVRRIEIIGRIVYINGEKIKVKGANRHDSHPHLGHATPYEHIKRDLLIMKANNMNMVRTSHYPNDPRFGELCDRYGLYMCDEADLECHGVDIYRDHPLLTDDINWQAAYLDRAERLLERDKNHPSIIMWSVGNESGPGINHEAMAKYFKERDPDRIVHVEDESRRSYNIIELERPKGIVGDVDPEHYRSYYDIESRMYPRLDVIKNHYLNPEKTTKPLFLCEYCHAMGNGPGDIIEYVELMYEHDDFFGGCVWELLDHSVATGEYRYAAPKFVYGGDMGEFPHDSNFCVDGLLYPNRKPHTGMHEVKTAYAPFKATYDGGVLTVESRKYFESLSDLTLYYTVEKNGRVIASGSLGDMDIAPRATKKYENLLDGIILDGFVTLNISAKRNTACEWAEIGAEIAAAQFIISDSLKSSPKMLGAELSEDAKYYTVTFGESVVKIGKASGLIEEIESNGRSLITSPVTPTVWRAPTDNDRNVKNSWYKAHFDRLTADLREIKATAILGGVKISSSLILAVAAKEPAVRMTLDYTISEGMGISVECRAEVNENLPPLPRFGFIFKMPEDAEDVSYFGYGPYESYEDKRLASRISLFKTTVTENFEHYVRPQENSAHYGCRWATVSTLYGQGLYFSADKFSLSASHFTPEYLTVTAHDYELVPEKESTVIIDYRNAGIGSNSCGPELLPEYRISEREINFKFNIKPSFIGNVNPFDEYVK